MKRLPAIAALFLLPGVAFGQVTAPSVSVTAGDQTLTVAWDEPSGATIGSAYDLWYILSSERSASRSVPRGYSGLGAGSRDQPAVPVWTLLSDVASGKGDHYVILPRSLTNDAAYSVKVRHRQGTDDAWSTVVEGTPSEPSSTVALTLTLGTVVGGVVEGRDTDTYSATASSRTTMVCYVHAPNHYRQIYVTLSPEVEDQDFWQSAAGQNRRFVIPSGTRTFSISRGQASGTVEYEIVCRNTPAARSISRAHAMDIRYPADLEFGARNDSFFYSFRITESGAYAIGTAGILDSVLRLYDSSGTLLRNNDDGWQLGNVTSAAILESLTLDTDNDHDPGLYYVEVHLPYNTPEKTDEPDRNVPLYVWPADGGGTAATDASSLPIAYIGTQKSKAYFDIDDSSARYGKLSTAGEQDYWTFTTEVNRGYEDGTPSHVLIRGVGAPDSGLTGELVGYPDAYRRTDVLYGGRRGDGNVATFTIAARVSSGTHTLKVSSSNAADPGGIYGLTVVHDREIEMYDFASKTLEGACETTAPTGLLDPLFKCQWHLGSGGSADIKVQEAWEDGYTGDGIEIAIVDHGIDSLHPDLEPNVDTTKNYNVLTGSNEPFEPIYSHGNSVAGIIGAAANEHGIRGVAYDSTIYNFNLLAGYSDAREGVALSQNIATRGVSNHSYGPSDDGSIHRSSAVWNGAMDNMLSRGFGGLGTSYVNAAGNGGVTGNRGAVEEEYTQLDEHNSHFGAIPVCAVGQDAIFIPDISEQGTNLWVCGPSNGLTPNRGIFTTSQYGRWRYSFGGTSAPSPAVAGVVALMREANPALTWRDVKLILAESARKIDVAGGAYVDLEAEELGTDDNYSYSEQYGFGLVDAEAAIDLADGWTLLPELRSASACATNPVSPAGDSPDVPPYGQFKRDELVIANSGMDFIEYVEFIFDIETRQHGTFKVWVGGPDSVPGESSDDWVEVLNRHLYASGGIDGEYRVAVNRFVGRSADGAWKLAVTSNSRLNPVKLHSWAVRIYGHGSGEDGAVAVIDYVSPTACSRAGVEAAGPLLTLDAVTGTVAENSEWTSPAPTVTGTPVGALTWSLGGDDADDFTLDAATGVLTLPAQDYENPTDTDSDRVYEATLTATDTDSNTVTASVTVTVTDVDTEDDPNDWTRFSGTCVANDTTLCLQNNRFGARVAWKTDVDDAPSWGSVEVSRGASGVFSLRQTGDWSLLLSVLDGCHVSGGIWVIASDMPSQPRVSDYDRSPRTLKVDDRILNKAEYPLWTLIVRDTVTDNTVELTNHPEDLFNPDGRRSAAPVRLTGTRRAFPDVCTTSSSASSSLPVKVPAHFGGGLASVASAAVAQVSAATTCGEEEKAACLHAKFDVSVDWRSWESASTRETSTLIAENGSAAAFSFHHPEVIDAVVKISEQCANVDAPLDNRRGYFVSVGSTVINDGLQARVKDSRISGNPGFLRWWELMGTPFDPSKLAVGRGDVFVRQLMSHDPKSRIRCIK